MDMEYYSTDANGSLVVNSYGENFYDDEMDTFDPRKHLQGHEREKYLNFMAIKKQKLQEEREKLQKASGVYKDPFISAVEEEIKNRTQHEL